jgi:hypothetical protein
MLSFLALPIAIKQRRNTDRRKSPAVEGFVASNFYVFYQ